MKLTTQRKNQLLMLIDLLLIVFFLWAIICIMFNFFDCDHDGWSRGIKAFKYYTNWANLLLASVSLMDFTFRIRKKEIPHWLNLTKLIAVTSSTVTMITVYAVLASQAGIWLCFGFPAHFFEHTLSPILALISFFLSLEEPLKKRYALFGMLTTLLYSLIWIVVLLILNLPTEVETDSSVVPYFFLAIHNQPWYMTLLWFSLLNAGTYLISLLLIVIQRKIHHKQLQKGK